MKNENENERIFFNAMKELSVDVIFIIVVSVLVILFEEYL